jgi:hypothetical protein
MSLVSFVFFVFGVGGGGGGGELRANKSVYSALLTGAVSNIVASQRLGSVRFERGARSSIINSTRLIRFESCSRLADPAFPSNTTFSNKFPVPFTEVAAHFPIKPWGRMERGARRISVLNIKEKCAGEEALSEIDAGQLQPLELRCAYFLPGVAARPRDGKCVAPRTDGRTS